MTERRRAIAVVQYTHVACDVRTGARFRWCHDFGSREDAARAEVDDVRAGRKIGPDGVPWDLGISAVLLVGAQRGARSGAE